MEKHSGLFLLGGCDLEMQTIRDVLQFHVCAYADHHLQWNNARLSSYRKDIEEYLSGKDCGNIYGIELEKDMDAGSNYIAIDHHNMQSHAPSALEQVLSLLGVPMTRKYQLIAANDKSYIPGMLAMGATDEEVKNIREADRKAQGVTESEEYLAEKAISENLTRRGNLIVVRALCSRFSPICDRLYPYESLLVYTSDEWMFYGKGADKVVELFKEDFHNGKIFYGGGPQGYVGGKKGAYTEEEINEIVKNSEYEFV